MGTVDSIHARSDALLKLQPGDSIVYHVGLLARDRNANFSTGAARFLAGAVDRLASLVMAQAARGDLLLLPAAARRRRLRIPLLPAGEPSCSKRSILSTRR
jgi:hypothetical protein